ncbi:hypothetical protein BC827DRAFT_1387313 [Russula dissimulans]|nr:hypothetical protein BC827DRAFT_1387313 [Russula dissimulans]
MPRFVPLPALVLAEGRFGAPLRTAVPASAIAKCPPSPTLPPFPPIAIWPHRYRHPQYGGEAAGRLAMGSCRVKFYGGWVMVLLCLFRVPRRPRCGAGARLLQEAKQRLDALRAAVRREVFSARVVVKWAVSEDVFHRLDCLPALAGDLVRVDVVRREKEYLTGVWWGAVFRPVVRSGHFGMLAMSVVTGAIAWPTRRLRFVGLWPSGFYKTGLHEEWALEDALSELEDHSPEEDAALRRRCPFNAAGTDRKLNAGAFESAPGKRLVPTQQQLQQQSQPQPQCQQPPPPPALVRNDESTAPPTPLLPTISLNGGSRPPPAARDPDSSHPPSTAPPPAAKPRAQQAKVAAPSSSAPTPPRAPGNAFPAAALSSETFAMGRAKANAATIAQEVAEVADQQMPDDLSCFSKNSGGLMNDSEGAPEHRHHLAILMQACALWAGISCTCVDE